MWTQAVLILAGSAAGTYLATLLAKRYATLPYRKVLVCTSRIETFMQEMLKARGEGLHAKINNVIDRLDREEIHTLRRIATIQSRMFQESGAKIRPEEFDRLCRRIGKIFKEKYGRAL